MKIKVTAAIAFLLLICLALVGQTSAQTRIPGVQNGDHFTYSITSHWTSTNTSAVAPSDLLEFNNTKCYNLTVSNVAGSNITSDDIWSFLNGTDKSAVVIQNILSGESLNMNGLVKIVGADIGENDVFYPSSSEVLVVNRTSSRIYSSGEREINVLVFIYPIDDPTTNSTGTIAYTYFFDKATGVLVEERDETDLFGEYSAVFLQLTDTNVWAISGASVAPSSDLSNIILFGIIAAVIIIVLVVSIISYSLLHHHSHKKSIRK